ncbi:type II toxin-antitoxin system ParD family antitoxin [Dyadobacter jiangsuensis]
MAAKTFISLDQHFENFIQKQLKTGRYASASEVIQAGLRLLEKEDKLTVLRHALVEGEQSGWVHDFDPEEFKIRMLSKPKS